MWPPTKPHLNQSLIHVSHKDQKKSKEFVRSWWSFSCKFALFPSIFRFTRIFSSGDQLGFSALCNCFFLIKNSIHRKNIIFKLKKNRFLSPTRSPCTLFWPCETYLIFCRFTKDTHLDIARTENEFFKLERPIPWIVQLCKHIYVTSLNKCPCACLKLCSDRVSDPVV